MRVGTKSLLFGVHQFIWHPITVGKAWRHLYGVYPTWKELLCIIVHDWGYWGKDNLNGPSGEMHPIVGARIAHYLLDKDHTDRTYGDLVMLHSRHYARFLDKEPSKLCWADKLSMSYDPRWFYLTRARLSGELAEYRKLAHEAGVVWEGADDNVWYDRISTRLMVMGIMRDPTVLPHMRSVLDQVTKDVGLDDTIH